MCLKMLRNFVLYSSSTCLIRIILYADYVVVEIFYGIQRSCCVELHLIQDGDLKLNASACQLY